MLTGGAATATTRSTTRSATGRTRSTAASSDDDGDTLAVLGTAGDDTLDVIVTGMTIIDLEGGSVTGIETVTFDALGEATAAATRCPIPGRRTG